MKVGRHFFIEKCSQRLATEDAAFKQKQKADAEALKAAKDKGKRHEINK